MSHVKVTADLYKKTNDSKTPCMRNFLGLFTPSRRVGLETALVAVFLLLFGANRTFSQTVTTNAFHQASDPAHAGDGPGNGLGTASPSPTRDFDFGA
jgi:hypothetical protein